MLGTILEGLGALSSSNSPTIDNHVFRLHYVFTSSILIAASTVLVTNQFFGDPIDCISDGSYHKEEALKKTIDNFCWVAATYTVQQRFIKDQKRHGDYLIYDGVGQFDSQSQTRTFQLYYRWVFFIVFIQGLIFYLPHLLWKSWEAGKMAGLSKVLDCPVEPTLDDDRRRTRIALLLDSLEACDVNSHNWYTYRFYLCEVSNLALLIFNFGLTNYWLDYQFWPAGFDVFKKGFSSSDYILSKLFPTHAKCNWRTSGPGGGIQTNDALCILPLNSFNRMFFTCLWFWYICIGFLTGGWLIFRACLIAFTPMRATFLRWKGNSIKLGHHSYHDQLKKSGDCYDYICKKIPHEDWFVIYQLADTLDPTVFQSVISGLCERLSFQANDLSGRRPTCPILGLDALSSSMKSKKSST